MKVKRKITITYSDAEVIRNCSCGKEPGDMLALVDNKIVMADSGKAVKNCPHCGEAIAYADFVEGMKGEMLTALPDDHPSLALAKKVN